MDESQKNLPTKVVKTWFFERGDGKIFSTDEKEAWGILRNKSNWMRTDFKIIGVSDGQTYVKTIKSADKERQLTDSKVNEKTAELNRYLATLDKFKFEMLLEDTDEKVVKVKGIIKGIQDEITELQSKFSKGFQDIINMAFEAELAVARGHIEMPSNFDVITPNEADRRIIMNNLPR